MASSGKKSEGDKGGDKKKPGLYANIHAKQERIAHGSGETMRRPGADGAPTTEAFDKAAKGGKTAKKPARRK